MAQIQRTLLLVASLCFTLPAQTFAQTAPQNDSVTRSRFLSAWLEAYEHAELKPSARSQTDAKHHKLYLILDEASLKRPRSKNSTHLSELDYQLRNHREHPSTENTRFILALAGTEASRGGFEQATFRIRQLAERELAALKGTAVQFALIEALESSNPSIVATALRALGEKRRPVFRSPIAKQLKHEAPSVRGAAAEALATLGTARALQAVSEALHIESHPQVVHALIRSTHSILDTDGETLRHLDQTRALRHCLRTLGKHGWRTDLSTVELIADHPSLEAIDALITLLAFEQQQAGKLRSAVAPNSPILRHRTWLVLRSLLGVDLPLHAPELWRKWWLEHKRGFVWQKREILQTELAPGSSNFYGIPVLGSRVAFIIDTSGSMNTIVQPGQDSSQRAMQTRLQIARTQTIRAAQSLRRRSRFFLITFSSTAKRWNDEALPPTEAAMDRLTLILDGLRANGGTNFGAALLTGLQVTDERAQTGMAQVDEIFFMSDGEPSVGITKAGELLDAVRRANRYRNIRINTIYTGEGKAPRLMLELASQNGGLSVTR